MTHIHVDHLSIEFPLYHGGGRSLRKAVLSTATGGRVARDENERVLVKALDDISFRLQPGDRLGLVGGNGAGKTTLLRALAGIYEPVRGTVSTQGLITTLIDPNLGMNMDLTGRENIALRGLFSGLGEAQVNALTDDVAEFAELGDFLEMPVRTYSSGMVVRLGFALATAIHPQILLMDEWFLAGDAAFMEKARKRLESLIGGVEILVLSTHLLDVVQRWCTKVIWLEGGKVRHQGDVYSGVHAYMTASGIPI
ncbi:ABC transporter ATP-binding protein [Alsobacter sp. KACC 23698]|uniref:ABC transporter ATP-binding protein n=1 Tax=Alsobacter sp. KACC 23698 TaxID=3149229 RepID=A0AAU7JJ09_9HYPH